MTAFPVAPLGELCEVLDSRRKPITKRDREPGPYPYFGATGVLDHVSGFLFDEPLVLVGEDGAKWGAGENSAFPVDGRVWVNNHAHVLRPSRSKLIDQWLIYYLNFVDLSGFVSGLTVPKLNQGSLREIPVPIPSVPEQKRIVAILDEAFAGIATAKANAKKNLENARAIFDSQLQSVFSLGKEAWRAHQLDELTQSDSPITYGVVKPGIEGEIPFVRGGDLVRGKVRVSELRTISRSVSDQYRRTLLQGGELLICLVGQPGQVAVAPKELAGANIARQVGLIRLKPSMNAEFVRYFLQSPPGKEVLGARESGSVQQVINLGELRHLSVPYPELEEQNEIVKELDAFQADTQRLESLYTRKLAALDELKQSLLHQAFSGQLS